MQNRMANKIPVKIAKRAVLLHPKSYKIIKKVPFLTQLTIFGILASELDEDCQIMKELNSLRNEVKRLQEIQVIVSKISIAIQINGKTRGVIDVKSDLNKEKIISIAKNDVKIKKYLQDKSVIREIYVPNKIINFVI